MKRHLGRTAFVMAGLAAAFALSTASAQASGMSDGVGRNCFMQAGIFGATAAVDPKANYTGQLPSGPGAGVYRERVSGEELDHTIGFDIGLGCSAAYADGGPFADPPNNSGLRADISYSYRRTSDFDGVVTPTETIHSKFDSHALMFNMYYDMQRMGHIQPYIGAGIGLARVSHDDVSLTDGVNTLTFAGNEQWNVAWQLMAGVGIPLSDRAVLDLGYRYINLGDITTTEEAFCGCTSVGTSTLEVDNLEHHEFRLGIRVNFSGHHAPSHEPYK